MTLAQVRALELGMGDLGAAVITLAGSGLRIGELLGLDVSDVDFLRRSIRVERHTGPLFVNVLGRPLTYRQWKPLWKAASGKAKVDATAHAMRHFYASALIAGGASVKQVQTVLGHASAVVTLRTYAHLWPGDDDRTRSIIDATFSASADQVRTDGVL